MAVYALGIACVAWTLLELATLLRTASSTPAPVRIASKPTEARARAQAARAARPRRVPLAAWDDRGRPIFVEDVSLRGAN